MQRRDGMACHLVVDNLSSVDNCEKSRLVGVSGIGVRAGLWYWLLVRTEYAVG